MQSDIASTYIRHHPREAAEILDSFAEKELNAYLRELSTDEIVAVANHLLPSTVGQFLVSVDNEKAADVLEHLRSDTVSKILGGLESRSRREILDALTLEKRQNVLHRLKYPADSIGSMMTTRTLVCRVDADVKRARAIVRRFADTALPIVVVVDDEMRPVGTIGISMLVGLKQRELVKDSMQRITETVRAVEAISTVSTLSAWASSDYLAVVDGHGRYVGLISKSVVQTYMIATTGGSSKEPVLFDGALAVAEMFWVPVAEMLVRATTGTVERSHENESG